MALELLLGVASAVVKISLRAFAEPDTADAIDDAHSGLALLLGARQQETELGKVIAKELEQQLGSAAGEEETELRVAAEEVTHLLNGLADDPAALILAATYPDQFLDYARRHGGDQKRRLLAERVERAFDKVLEAACAQFIRLAPTSPGFMPAGLAEILRQLPIIGADARQAAHEARRVYQVISPEDQGVVAASRAASNSGVVLGRPVGSWTPAELGVHASNVDDGVTGLIPYLLRDHDAKLREDLAQLRQPGAGARLVIIVGTSCAGKTRTAYEAVNEVLSDWNLVKPADIEVLTRIVRSGIPGQTVVWLDELQDYLTDHGVEAARAIHRLIDDPDTPSIAFLATIWPLNLTRLEQRPDPVSAQAGLGESRICSRKRPLIDTTFRTPSTGTNLLPPIGPTHAWPRQFNTPLTARSPKSWPEGPSSSTGFIRTCNTSA